jgi:transcriptional regulator with XRE-family HTH domain
MYAGAVSEAAALLRRTRREAGLTQAELARRAGMTQPVVAAYEAGRREPTLPMLRKLLAAAGAELETRARRYPDARRAARDLRAVLDLADTLPHRRAGPLRYPRLPAR